MKGFKKDIVNNELNNELKIQFELSNVDGVDIIIYSVESTTNGNVQHGRPMLIMKEYSGGLLM